MLKQIYISNRYLSIYHYILVTSSKSYDIVEMFAVHVFCRLFCTFFVRFILGPAIFDFNFSLLRLTPPVCTDEASHAGSRSNDYSSAFLWFSAPPPLRLWTKLNILVCCCCSSWPGLPEPPSLRSRSKQRSHSFRALPASKTLSVWTCVLSLYLKLKAKMSPTHIWELPRWRKWL